jgi:hypothetical protein
MYTELRDRIKCDRLGTHLLCYVAQIIICVKSEIYLFLPQRKLNHDESIFLKSLYYFISNHNSRLRDREIELGESTDVGSTNDMNWIMGRAVQCAQKSIPEFFRETIWPEISAEFFRLAAEMNYPLPAVLKEINWHNKIVCHLRLDDIVGRGDYRMWKCVEHYRQLLESGAETPIEDIFDEDDQRHNCQRELPDVIVEEQLWRAMSISGKKTEDIVLIMSPNSKTELPYKSISNPDESLDLYMMCMSEHFIGSRSTYAICAYLWGCDKWATYPRWGHLTCTGVGTNFCALKNLDEFY